MATEESHAQEKMIPAGENDLISIDSTSSLSITLKRPVIDPETLRTMELLILGLVEGIGAQDAALAERLLDIFVVLRQWGRADGKEWDDYLTGDMEGISRYRELLPKLTEIAATIVDERSKGNFYFFLYRAYSANGQLDEAVAVLSNAPGISHAIYNDAFARTGGKPAYRDATLEIIRRMDGEQEVDRLVVVANAALENGDQDEAAKLFQEAWKKSTQRSKRELIANYNHNVDKARYFVDAARKLGIQFDGQGEMELLQSVRQAAVKGLEEYGRDDQVMDFADQVIFELTRSGLYAQAEELVLLKDQKGRIDYWGQVDAERMRPEDRDKGYQHMAIGAAYQEDYEKIEEYLGKMIEYKPDAMLAITKILGKKGHFENAFITSVLTSNQMLDDYRDKGDIGFAKRVVFIDKGESLYELGKAMLEYGWEKGAVAKIFLKAAEAGLGPKQLGRLIQTVREYQELRSFVPDILERVFAHNVAIIKSDQHDVILAALREFFPELTDIVPNIEVDKKVKRNKPDAAQALDGETSSSPVTPEDITGLVIQKGGHPGTVFNVHTPIFVTRDENLAGSLEAIKAWVVSEGYDSVRQRSRFDKSNMIVLEIATDTPENVGRTIDDIGKIYGLEEASRDNKVGVIIVHKKGIFSDDAQVMTRALLQRLSGRGQVIIVTTNEDLWAQWLSSPEIGLRHNGLGLDLRSIPPASSPVTLNQFHKELAAVREKLVKRMAISYPETIANLDQLLGVIAALTKQGLGISIEILYKYVTPLFNGLEQEGLIEEMFAVQNLIKRLEVGDFFQMTRKDGLDIMEKIKESEKGLRALETKFETQFRNPSAPPLSKEQETRLQSIRRLIELVRELRLAILESSPDKPLILPVLFTFMYDVAAIKAQEDESGGDLLSHLFDGPIQNLMKAVERVQFGGYRKSAGISTWIQETAVGQGETSVVNLEYLISIRAGGDVYYLMREGDKVIVTSQAAGSGFDFPFGKDYERNGLKIRLDPADGGIYVTIALSRGSKTTANVLVQIIERKLTPEEAMKFLAAQKSPKIEGRGDGDFPYNRGGGRSESPESMARLIADGIVEVVEINGRQKFVPKPSSSPVTVEDVRGKLSGIIKLAQEAHEKDDSYFVVNLGYILRGLIDFSEREGHVLTSQEVEDFFRRTKAYINLLNDAQEQFYKQTKRRPPDFREILRPELEAVTELLNKSLSGSVAGQENPGGIDLNPALLDLQIKRDGNGVPLPLPQQPIENMRIEGFIPIIINVTPVTNLPMLLGLADEEKNQQEVNPELKARELEEIISLN